MNIHWFQHVPFEGLGSIADWTAQRRHRVTATRLFAGDPLPALERVDWLMVMGGPMNIYEHARYPWLVSEKRFIQEAIAARKIVLGVCLGAQLIADALGAQVYRNAHREIGWFPVEKTRDATNARLFDVFPSTLEVFHWHGETFDLPVGAIHLARSEACEQQAFVYGECVIGLQFHLETTRASIEQLIANCADEIVDAAFIQTAEVMLADQRRFARNNATMNTLLDCLETRRAR